MLKRRILLALFILEGFMGKGQISSCGKDQVSYLKSTYLSYVRIGDPLGGHFRFLNKVIMQCGIPIHLNPLYILEPEKGNRTYASAGWQLDSSTNVTSVFDPCLVFPTQPCYSVYYYHADVDLDYNKFGYVAAIFDCCRPPTVNIYDDGVNDFFYETPLMSENANDSCAPSVGTQYAYNAITSFIKIPAFSSIAFNNTPQFNANDTILFLCKGKPFNYNLSATDADGDSLAYHFSSPRTFRLQWDPKCIGLSCTHYIQPTPPYPLLTYNSPYSQDQPAGSGVTLDATTGILQGTINDTGVFVIPVSVLEFRKNKIIDSVTQEVLVKVFDCPNLPPPKASIPNLINNCNNFLVQFPNNSSPLYPSRVQNTSFLWDFGDGDTSTAIYPLHQYADTGNYHVRLIEFPGLYCADTAYANVLVFPYVKASYTHDDSCSDKLIHFINTSSSTGGSINYNQWVIKLGDKVLDSSLQTNIDFDFVQKPKTYEVLLTVGTTKGCKTTDTSYINIYPSPLPLGSHDTVVSRFAPIQLMANDGAGGANAQFVWTPSTGLNNPNIADPILTSNTDGTYYVSIRNYFGCTLVDSIHVRYFTGPDIYVPNAFTPNGDGKNDLFRPFCVGISTFLYFKVFDRHGMLVYQTEQEKAGWDGSIHGEPANAGTYVWMAKGIDFAGKPIFKKGTVVLIK
jgi:gliding motility-associated-like protein